MVSVVDDRKLRVPEKPPATSGSTARGLLATVRPIQSVKNLTVAVPLLLEATAWSWRAVGQVLLGIALFICAASATYVLNDLLDRDRDAVHPVKRLRPIASGAVRPRHAVLLAAVLYGVLALAVVGHPSAMAVPVVAYAVLNVLYSTLLKHVPLLDVFMLAAGFVLRVVCGALAAGSEPSPWLVTCVMSGALLLALGKRRREVSDVGRLGPADVHRPALRGYSQQLIDSLVATAGAVCMVAYVATLNASAADRPYALVVGTVSTPLAMFGVARYVQIMIVSRGGADPVRTVLRDPALLVAGSLWVLCLVIPPIIALATTGSS